MADCIWLPRILTKARLLLNGELPAAYAERFCHPVGVDSTFLGYFQLTKDDILAAAKKTDENVIKWFCSRPEGTPENIEKWNDIAVNMGRPGFPLAERFPVACETSYKHIDSRGMTTVFELLEADERLSGNLS